MTMSQLLPESVLPQMERLLTSSVADSPARIFRPQGRVQALPASVAAYGKSTPELLGKFDPATRLLKTLAKRCFIEGYQTFSSTFPRSGTMRNGTVYQLQPLAPLTGATGCGSWPTPTSSDGHGQAIWDRNGISGRHNLGLGTAIRDAADADSESVGRIAITWVNVVSGSLNPTWVEWLMGFPLGWTDLDPRQRRRPRDPGNYRAGHHERRARGQWAI